eukprot:CAMPEP_0169107646 /NCGR_PEP_ID=MMETSP1015-20121227/25001_1 /TAXON_ID=342587 /ORGANISM="Karlodinium micrum, Strain CCMP2283" /LENGTH=157 /DNA_ID=CAMNT_0009169207 /DNA_START=94 /DNA_END=567 /DNA_ORIENTATION=+
MFCCCAEDDSKAHQVVHIDDFQENTTKNQPGHLREIGAGIEIAKAPEANRDDETPADGAPVATRTVQADGTFRVNVVKTKETKLGMRLDYSDSTLLKVTHVRDGIIQDWNMKNPTASVSVNDCIISINGKKGAAADLLEEIASKNSLDIVFKKFIST